MREDPCDKSGLWSWDRADDLRECAEAGHRGTQIRFGKLLALNGHSTESEVWLAKAIESRGARGAMEVAHAFEQYDGDRQLAERWYQKAYELGESEAAVRLGMLREEDGDRVEADRWFERAVALGRKPADVGFRLSHEPESASSSTAWYKRAAEMGDLESMSQYAHRLGDGIGVAKNVSEAFRWLGRRQLTQMQMGTTSLP